ncbi:MAG: ParB/RepB/Spo0J family partition protein [Rhizobiaceae bacterium]
MEDSSKRRLGRGLAALIGEIDRAPSADAVETKPAADLNVPIEFVSPNPRNPRRHFDEADLSDLAQSIREHGIVQPVIVRNGAEKGRYEIIAGERRWRAAQRAGLTAIPVLVREVNDRTALELAIIENVQRADLNPLEEAAGYQQLIDDHSYTQADLGQVIGKSRSHVANTLRLLKLPETVRTMVADGQLTAGHARTLITVEDPERLARRIVDEGLSVRQAETLSQAPAAEAKPAGSSVQVKDADTLALEKLLSDFTGLKVSIAHRQGGNAGEIRIAYRTLEQLDDLCRRLQTAG